MSNIHTFTGVVLDPIARTKFGARITVENGYIRSIENDSTIHSPFILPGLVDSHVHIESSMLTPVEFAKAASKHGTVATVCDPHEIANVAGVDGVNFMVDNAKNAAIKLFFGVPSCVPASPFDECFQSFTPELVEQLISRSDMLFLAEMMNYPGVVGNDAQVSSILNAAKSAGKPIDGHAPGLSGKQLEQYVGAGISTDHECFTLNEALEKIALGMKVLIREGSAAKNYNQLHQLIALHPNSVMFCTDDCHPDDLEQGHINTLLIKSVKHGYDLFDVLQVASVNPVQHYRLPVGLLQKGDRADFVVVNNLTEFNVISTVVNGVDVLHQSASPVLQHIPSYVFPTDTSSIGLSVIAQSAQCRVIGILPDELITQNLQIAVKKDDRVEAYTQNDILKIVVLSRYAPSRYSVGFIKGVGLKRGAIAASIAHDSHHIIAIGADDDSIIRSIDFIVANRGGICYCSPSTMYGLPLPVFGLMTNLPVSEVAALYSQINNRVIADGCSLKAPFMTMAFMSLTVIPKLKITPSGLFDVEQFKPVDMFC